MATKNLKPQIILPFENKVYGVNYDWSSTGCNGCGGEYCRCSRIYGEKVTDIIWNWIVKELCPDIGPNHSLDFYLIEKFLRRFLSLNDFEVRTCGGYYGEEIDGVYLRSGKDCKPVDFFNSLQTQAERLQYILRQEYGHLLPDIENVKEWEIRKVKIEEVNAFEGHMKHVNLKTVEEYTQDLPIIICICLWDGKKYRLMDGRHRFTAAKERGEKTINIVVPKTRGKNKPSLSADEQLRAQALAKLTLDEKRVLGLL